MKNIGKPSSEELMNAYLKQEEERKRFATEVGKDGLTGLQRANQYRSYPSSMNPLDVNPVHYNDIINDMSKEYQVMHDYKPFGGKKLRKTKRATHKRTK